MDAGPATDAPPPPPDAAVASYGGDYGVSSVWDLSSPFSGDGLGGLVADLLIDKIIDIAPIPGWLEGQARDFVADHIRQIIVDAVNGAIPPDLYNDSAVMVELSAILSEVQVDGTLHLVADGEDSDQLTGTQRILAITVYYHGTPFALDIDELLAGSDVVEIAADLDGIVDGTGALSLADHDFEIRYGMLVALAAREALGIDAFALADSAAAAIDCNAMVGTITGGDGSYEFSVGGYDFSISAASLVSACDDLRDELTQRALGLFSRDLGARVGGDLTQADNDGDGITDSLTSVSDYGGIITSFPIFTPRVSVSLYATRPEQ